MVENLSSCDDTLVWLDAHVVHGWWANTTWTRTAGIAAMIGPKHELFFGNGPNPQMWLVVENQSEKNENMCKCHHVMTNVHRGISVISTDIYNLACMYVHRF